MIDRKVSSDELRQLRSSSHASPDTLLGRMVHDLTQYDEAFTHAVEIVTTAQRVATGKFNERVELKDDCTHWLATYAPHPAPAAAATTSEEPAPEQPMQTDAFKAQSITDVLHPQDTPLPPGVTARNPQESERSPDVSPDRAASEE